MGRTRKVVDIAVLIGVLVNGRNELHVIEYYCDFNLLQK